MEAWLGEWSMLSCDSWIGVTVFVPLELVSFLTGVLGLPGGP